MILDVSTCHEKILKGDVKYPKQFSDSAKDLIKKLLEADLTKRIGCLKGGVQELKSHAWFSSLDWSNVLLKKDIPPIRPKVSVILAFELAFETFPQMEDFKVSSKLIGSLVDLKTCFVFCGHGLPLSSGVYYVRFSGRYVMHFWLGLFVEREKNLVLSPFGCPHRTSTI